MYEFHYDYIKNKYDNKSQLLFTDADSLMYESKTEDVYEGLSSNTEIFEFSTKIFRLSQNIGSLKQISYWKNGR